MFRPSIARQRVDAFGSGRTVAIDGLRFVAQPGIEPDRRREQWRRVHVGQQAPGFVQMPAHDAGCSLDFLARYRTGNAILQQME